MYSKWQVIGYVRFIDDVVDEFMPSIKNMEADVEEIDDMVLYLKRTNQTEMLRRIGYSRNRVKSVNKITSVPK